MKKIFTILLVFLACFSAKAQLIEDSDIFDFDTADTFYYYHSYTMVYLGEIGSRLFIDTVNYKHNQWRIGKPNKKVFDSSYSLPNAIVTDTSFPCLPNDTSVFFLKLPNRGMTYFDWPIHYLSFAYRLNIDSGDIALVEASIDSCKTWTNILVDTGRIWSVRSVPNLSVSTSYWDSAFVDAKLSLTIPNDTLYMRFTFITGSDTTARDGWMIDHIMASHYTEGVADVERSDLFQLYPNPATIEAKLKLTQALKTDCQMTVVDALGRQVFQHRLNKGSTDYSLNVQDWTKGLYFIELADGMGNKSVRKLMVE